MTLFADFPRLRSLPTNVRDGSIVCQSATVYMGTRGAILMRNARLMKEATINAKQAGERGISAKSVKKVTEVIYWC